MFEFKQDRDSDLKNYYLLVDLENALKSDDDWLKNNILQRFKRGSKSHWTSERCKEKALELAHALNNEPFLRDTLVGESSAGNQRKGGAVLLPNKKEGRG